MIQRDDKTRKGGLYEVESDRKERRGNGSHVAPHDFDLCLVMNRNRSSSCPCLLASQFSRHLCGLLVVTSEL